MYYLVSKQIDSIIKGKNILEWKEVTQGDYVSYFIPTLVYGNSYLCCGWVFCI